MFKRVFFGRYGDSGCSPGLQRLLASPWALYHVPANPGDYIQVERALSLIAVSNARGRTTLLYLHLAHCITWFFPAASYIISLDTILLPPPLPLQLNQSI